MGGIVVGSRAYRQHAWLFRAISFLLMIAAMSVLAPFESAAHQLHSDGHRAPVATVKQHPASAAFKDASILDTASLTADVGFGCSIIGLAASGQGFPMQGWLARMVSRRTTTQAVLEISMAPPCPPPNNKFRIQTD